MYQTPVKMDNKKKLEIIGLIIAIIWALIFIINYTRYTDSKPLILAIHKTIEYDDGTVEEYISLGYVYRKYSRNSVKGEELKPFWVARQNPKPAPDLPVVPTGYDVPTDNYSKEDKFRGLLYYYVKRELAGTYKCINTDRDCIKAFGGYDSYNIINKDPLTALSEQHTLGSIHDKFGFVDDSNTQNAKYGDGSYVRTVYLYQFLTEDPKILARFADVKESTYNESDERAYGDGSKYIVKSMDNNKWGIINIKEDGTIEQVLPYEYESINYDSDTKFYIICKDGLWYVYDLTKNEKVSVESVDPIYDVWRNNNLTYYIKTGKDRTVGNESFTDYKIFRMEDGREFLNIDRVTQIFERESYVAYLTSTDNKLHFIDYGKTEKYTINLKFSQMKHTTVTNPAFTIRKESGNTISINVYKQRAVIDRSNDYDTISINIKYWS